MVYDNTMGYGLSLDSAVAKWREALESLSTVHRRRILLRFSIVEYWVMMFERICGWSREQALEWVDKEHSLPLFYAWGEGRSLDYEHESAIEWIHYELVKPEILSKFPPKSREYLAREVTFAISNYTEINVYDPKYPWEGVKFAVEYVAQFWANRGPPYVVVFDNSIRDCYPREDQPQGKKFALD